MDKKRGGRLGRRHEGRVGRLSTGKKKTHVLRKKGGVRSPLLLLALERDIQGKGVAWRVSLVKGIPAY